MDDTIGAEYWHGEYVCEHCGMFLKGRKAVVLGVVEREDRHDEIQLCPKCGSLIQIEYEVHNAG